MKRIDIVGFINFRREDWDIRPSMVEKTRRAFHDSEVWTYKDLCACTEKQLLKTRHVTPELVEHIKETLESAGLHLGMTEKELDAYHDAEYDERHPSIEPKGAYIHDNGLKMLDEATILEALRKKPVSEVLEKETGIFIPEDVATEQIVGTSEGDVLINGAKETASSANTGGTQKKGTEPLQETETKHKEVFDAQKAYNHAMARILRDPCQMLRSDDLEFMRHQLVMSVLEQQSWLMKTFCSFKYRVKVAMQKANYIMQEYRHDMGLRSTVYQHLEYEGRIKELEA